MYRVGLGKPVHHACLFRTNELASVLMAMFDFPKKSSQRYIYIAYAIITSVVFYIPRILLHERMCKWSQVL